MITTRPCLRCGRPIVSCPKPGRPRKWCSAKCRRLASEERRAAESGLLAVEEVEKKVTLDDHLRAVLDSPAACRRVLRRVGEWSASGELGDAKWSSVADELERLRHRALPRRWR